MAANIKTSGRREVAASNDKIMTDREFKSVLMKMSSCLDETLKSSPSSDGIESMVKIFGYSLQRAKSRLRDGGTGVIMSSGSAERGDFIAFYPGTLYRRFEPLLLPSLGNSFILRCMDGVHIDGNDRFLSKTIYRSCVLRDSFGRYQAADLSWTTQNPKVPWNIGQYVNNGTEEYPANVAYQEFDVLEDFPPELDYLLPNIWYSGPTRRHLRTVALVATKKIHEGDEILSNYVTIVRDPSSVTA